jgi:hypothetical protein
MNFKQQDILERFFKEETTWFPDHFGLAMAGYLVLGIAVLGLMFPFQVWEQEKTYLFFFYFELIGLYLLMQRYYVIRQDGKQTALAEVIRFLPVERKELAYYRLKKLLKICMRITGITMLCQVFFAAVIMHVFSPVNILVPLTLCFIAPMLLLGLACLYRK